MIDELDRLQERGKFTDAELARFLAVKLPTLWNWKRAGELPGWICVSVESALALSDREFNRIKKERSDV